VSDPSDDLVPTGTLRAAINLGNPVLAHGTAEEPGGVTVAMARAMGERLGVPVELQCVDAARKSFAALEEGRVDIAFLAAEPAREETVAFSAPYVTIEGVYAVAVDAPYTAAADVDRSGVRVGVKEGSAYDLFLTRTLRHATVVRGVEGTEVFVEQGLDVGAGIRQPLTGFVGDGDRYRLLEPAFMQIRQAVGTARSRGSAVAGLVADLTRRLVTEGFVRAELARAGHDPDLAATS
jgi:polar amino acid transport system substrate-binding protein